MNRKEKIHMRRHIDKIKDANYERGYVYNTNYHIIWVTKYRNACFTTPELVLEMKNLKNSIEEFLEMKEKFEKLQIYMLFKIL